MLEGVLYIKGLDAPFVRQMNGFLYSELLVLLSKIPVDFASRLIRD